jgi:hypothetical protein
MMICCFARVMNFDFELVFLRTSFSDACFGIGFFKDLQYFCIPVTTLNYGAMNSGSKTMEDHLEVKHIQEWYLLGFPYLL